MEDKLIFYSSSKDTEFGKNKNQFINNPDEFFFNLKFNKYIKNKYL